MSSPLKIIFAGSPDFAIPTFKKLIDSEHNIIAVYTQPDRPAGRGQHLHQCPVKTVALENNLTVYQPKSLKEKEEQKRIKALNADVMIVVAYGLLLPPEILNAPKYGCLNVHGSLLPKWRGAAPIQRAIQAGDEQTGITIMQMDEGLDTGPMLKKVTCKIKHNDTSETLFHTLADMGAETLLEVLTDLQENKLKPEAQNENEATIAPKIKKEESIIDWTKRAVEIDRMIRAFIPWPVAHTMFENESVRVLKAEAIETEPNATPGTIVSANKNGIDVATGKGVLRIHTLQFPGKKPHDINDILNAKKDVLIPNRAKFG